jgi:hypothetical protein
MWTLIDRMLHRILRKVLFLVMSSFVALGALGVAAGAFYYWLLEFMSRPAALASLALVMLIIAAAFLFAARGGKRTKKVRKSITPESPAAIPALAAMATEAAGDAVRADPLGSMLSASALGFILESRPEIDQALMQQIMRQFTR